MKRRLIKQSRSTLTVSMPSTWIQKNKLKAGDELDVFERDTTLLLEAIQKKGEYNFELKIDKDNAWYIGQIIRYCYFANFEKTRLFFTSATIMQTIREEVQKLIGFEIIEEEKDYCVIKNISFEMEEEYPTLFRKVFLLTIQIFEELEKEKPNLQVIKSLHKDGQRFALFCRRVIIRNLDSLQKMNEYILLQRLTMISNNLVYFASEISQEKRVITVNEKVNLLFCKKLYHLYYTAYYTPEYNKLLALNEGREYFTKMIRKQKDNTFTQQYFCEIVRLLSSSGSLILYGGLKK